MQNEHTPQSTPQGTKPYATDELGMETIGKSGARVRFIVQRYTVNTPPTTTPETGSPRINLKALGLFGLVLGGAALVTATNNWGPISDAVVRLLGK